MEGGEKGTSSLLSSLSYMSPSFSPIWGKTSVETPQIKAEIEEEGAQRNYFSVGIEKDLA